jgi:hypothetical protein
MLPLFVSDVPLSCINDAAMLYHVPAKLIISVLNTERGKIGMAMPNRNGTYDLGPMQINTSWWPRLYRYAISPDAVKNNPCINVKVGTWILGGELAKSPDLLSGVGNYHSHTLRFNQAYTQQVRVHYTYLTKTLI